MAKVEIVTEEGDEVEAPKPRAKKSVSKKTPKPKGHVNSTFASRAAARAAAANKQANADEANGK